MKIASDAHPLVRALLAVLVGCGGSAASAPDGLRVNWQGSPALGVEHSAPAPLLFGWVVPSCPHKEDATQTGYRIVVTHDFKGGGVVWDSGSAHGNSSIAVRYGGPTLAAGTAYRWRVTTTTTGGCTSEPSAEALFITACDWKTSSAGWIGLGNKTSTFNLARRVVIAPRHSEVQRAVAFVSAQNSWSGMLMNYKLWVNGVLASVGPGRGEAAVRGGDGRFRSQPYNTVDLTPFLPVEGGPVVLALQAMQFGGFNPNTENFPFPCAADVQCNGPSQISQGPAVLMQVDLHTIRRVTTTWATEAATWKVLNADAWLQPDVRPKVCYFPGCSAGSGSGRMEHTDARNEPLGWRENSTFDDSSWSRAVAISTPSLSRSQLIPRMAGAAVEVTAEIAPIRTTSIAASVPQSFFVEWGQEFTGGLRLTVTDGKAGQVVRLRTGELCSPMVFNKTAFGGMGQNTSSQCHTVEQGWGWDFNWTLRNGPQIIEQHQYMIFRYLTVEWMGDAAPPIEWSVDAWAVNAPFEPEETFFSSSDHVLNRVWDLAANTLHRGVLDTYTDSNARERRPYEADGFITAGNRMLLQNNNVMWARHSHSWVFEFPTWPVEWLMITPMLAYQDYWHTGSAELATSYFELLFNNTQYPFGFDHTLGLMNTSKPGSRDVELWNYTGRHGGRHLIGWAPAPIDDQSTWMWSASDFMSVPQFYTVRGLELLAELARAAGRTDDAEKCTNAAAGLRKGIVKHMWDVKAQRYCDGICTEVAGNHSIYSDMYSLWLGVVPEASVANVWDSAEAWGMEHLGDLGMFVFMKALAAHPGDSGEAALRALTKCDQYSWCNEIRARDASMTRETTSLTGGTMSHGWGTATVGATVDNLVGLKQTAPGYARFSVKPQLGGLTSLTVKIPTPHGPIWVNATSSTVDVSVPCNTYASLCLQVTPASAGMHLALDGWVAATERRVGMNEKHSCIHQVGCGAAGAPRRLAWVQA